VGDRSHLLKSYLKTTVACLLLAVAALVVGVVILQWLPPLFATIAAILSALVALVAATFACAGAVVIVRYRRCADGARDVFLELNRSREPAAIAASTVRRTWLRRWLAQRLLGHDFVVGDWVEVKTWDDIRATLDATGCLEQLPFMPEMLAMCGRRAYVFRCMHRLFDYRKSRRMRHMDGAVLLTGTICNGSSHGGCEAACHTIWKAAWLRRVDREPDTARLAAAPVNSPPHEVARILQMGTMGPRYTCQLTQLHAASRPIGEWSPLNFLRPLVSGNVAPAAFAIGWLTDLFNDLQQQRGGIGFPSFTASAQESESRNEKPLLPGDQVVVRQSGEIRATLNDRLIHRGLGFEEDMLKYCGRQLYVQAEVKKLIDIVTGEMRTMKTPAYILRDVHFSGERQLFNAQYEPLFWRQAWLKRAGNNNLQ